MSYRIEYTSHNAPYPEEKGGSALRVILTLTVFALFLFVLHNYFPDHYTDFQKMLWPGDPEVTKNALSLMVGHMKDGLPFSQAAAAFCNEIFQNAGVH